MVYFTHIGFNCFALNLTSQQCFNELPDIVPQRWWTYIRTFTLVGFTVKSKWYVGTCLHLVTVVQNLFICFKDFCLTYINHCEPVFWQDPKWYGTCLLFEGLWHSRFMAIHLLKHVMRDSFQGLRVVFAAIAGHCGKPHRWRKGEDLCEAVTQKKSHVQHDAMGRCELFVFNWEAIFIVFVNIYEYNIIYIYISERTPHTSYISGSFSFNFDEV